MKDTSLENMAQRIRDRAVRRGGELLAQMKAKPGGDPKKLKGRHFPISQKQAATEAGLTPDQAKQMLRVASVPEPQFEDIG